MSVKTEVDGVRDAAVAGAAAPPRRAELGARLAAVRLSPDLLAVAALLIITVVLAWPPLAEEWALLRTDALIYFIPLWGFLGERLAAGDIPAWSPAQFAGAPFAGDPESGWMYLPTMLLFTVLPKVAAFKLLVLVHLALAALATFALGRVLGLGALAATVAATAYEFGVLLEFTRCCTAYVQIMVWLPVALLGVELGLRAGGWLGRSAAWTLAGFAVSQLLGSWLGQGAYNALLVAGGFVLYRTLLDPPVAIEGVRRRLGAMLLHGLAVLAIGFGLGAAGVLPRLEANEHSTLAGGVYAGAAAVYADRGGWDLPQALAAMLSIDANGLRYYAGGATLTLALLAPFLAGRRHALPFFAFVSTVAFVLTLEETPLHRLFYLLPRFELIHEHYPERALIVFYLGLSLLAGATVEALPRWRGQPWRFALLALLPLGALLLSMDWLQRGGRPRIDPTTPRAVAAMALLLVAYALVRVAWVRRLVPVLLLIAVVADPNGQRALFHTDWHDRQSAQAGAQLAAYQSEDGAAGYLLDRQRGGPVRFTGYDIAVSGHGMTYHSAYQYPIIPALLVNNRATYVGLHDLSGYNPLQPVRFRELLDALNRGQQQDYHQTNLLPAGLDSPLLDLLNVRYIVTPVTFGADRADMKLLTQLYPTVYQDAQVRVLENRDAFPRAWLVHDARQVGPGAALPLVASNSVNLRTTAVLETAPPPLASAADPAADRAEITLYEPDVVRLTAESDAPSLLMLADTYDPNWHAYVDGERTDLYVADHALRAVPLPAGAHTVELRFEPRALSAGIGISLGTVGLLAGVFGALGGARLRPGRRGHLADSNTG